MEENISKVTVTIVTNSKSSSAACEKVYLEELEENTEELDTTDTETYVNWTGTAYLVTNAYSNVTSSNNVFPDSPLVTNHRGNPGQIKVRIKGSNGAQIGGVKTISAGKSARLDQIPAMSGTYTLQAIAVTKAGNYSITID